MPPEENQLLALKKMLLVFSQSTRLAINYHKSSMVPINVSLKETNRLAAIFFCQVGKIPFTYLGLPVGTTRPRTVDLMPLVDCMERRMTASSSFLAQEKAARLEFCFIIFAHLLFMQCAYQPRNFEATAKDPKVMFMEKE